jgi:hypothetical protein
MITTEANGNGTKNGNGELTFNPPAQPTPIANLSQTDRDEILNLINIMREKLPFLKDLTAEERRNMSGMGNSNRAFAGKVLPLTFVVPPNYPPQRSTLKENRIFRSLLPKWEDNSHHLKLIHGRYDHSPNFCQIAIPSLFSADDAAQYHLDQLQRCSARVTSAPTCLSRTVFSLFKRPEIYLVPWRRSGSL